MDDVAAVASGLVLRGRGGVVRCYHGVRSASHPVQLGLDVSQTRLLPLEKIEIKTE